MGVWLRQEYQRRIQTKEIGENTVRYKKWTSTKIYMYLRVTKEMKFSMQVWCGYLKKTVFWKFSDRFENRLFNGINYHPWINLPTCSKRDLT